ncbi:UDP-3-O-(3-hydroxymyristoyl)glucosamine N-acyltransferase [Marinicella litoralis]|uniref:UDP-3-O-acylglucosamine N-acyltransferase n=1 Tax=Marinicella litoralis TaxID=644220 RepID=A0A4R6XJ12_9GAMM|nr:UDP-3-O-(3-hydroxymyristoyl)glucosamine N-acyltransferase [Marinicella litoralis]TDR19472.1 UDP-3-O-[3-hydroxymyristoyl] glucosamine N-acyltransferase [Marinicella litoralis]
MKTLAELATSQQLTYQGNGEVALTAVATLEHAKGNEISFLANPSYTKFLAGTKAGAVILTAKMAADYEGNALISDNPYVTFAYVAQLFVKQQRPVAKIHPTAVIEAGVEVGENVSIGAFSVLHQSVCVGAGTTIESHVSIADDVVIGEACVIKSGVKIEPGCVIGDRVILHPGAVIGADGFGLARDKSGWVKIPQTGAVVIGNDCEVGANTTIDCGAIEHTVLGQDVRLDNQIQIGHNVIIGDHTVIAGCTAVAGSTEIGRNCLIGGGVGIVGHIKICDGVTIQAMALVTNSIKEPGSYSSVSPLQPTKQWRKNAVRARQLDQIARKVNQLEKKLND